MVSDRLLEDLGVEQNCFISSLGDQAHRRETLLALERTQPESYTMEEWSYCLSYVFNQEVFVKNTQEIRSFLFKQESP